MKWKSFYWPSTGQWREKNKWSPELKRPKLRKINMSHDAKGGSRAGKPPPLVSVPPLQAPTSALFLVEIRSASPG
jgi:hypothetical protein